MLRIARIGHAAPVAAWLGLALAPGSAAAQAGEAVPPVAEERRVTAIDLVVEMNRRGRSLEPLVAPADLAPSDLRLARGGEAAPVVGIALPGDAEAEPWSMVLYFDRPLAAPHTVRWAAEQLAERSAALVALGEVEIVLADPEPRWVLAPTRDAQRVEEALSGLFLSTGGPALPVRLREDLLIGGREPRPRAAPQRRARRVLGREVAAVRRQGDRLLARLLEREPATPRRALLLVSDGFDLRPAEFYRPRLGAPGALPEVDLSGEVGTLADVLAAYGWVVGALAPPPPVEGVERFGVIPLVPPEGFMFMVSLRSIAAWLDKNRDPKKADAFVELGRSLRAQGKLEEAAGAFRKAVYHYYNHPKTAARQAAALVELGETLELAGERLRARAALRAATVYDPSLLPRYPFAEAELLAPHDPLDRLAEGTAGRRISDAAALDELLASLARRVRLTYQLAGTPDGSLEEIAIDGELPLYDLRYPRAGRWGTPEAIAELRLRALLEGSLDGGGLPLWAERTGRSALAVGCELPEAPELGGPRRVRLSWAARGRSGETRYGHAIHLGEALPAAGEFTADMPLSLPPRPRWLAVLAEDLATSAWGGSVLEIGSGR